MPVYIEKINGDVDQPTNRPTDRPTNRANIEQSAFTNVRKQKKGRDLQFPYFPKYKYEYQLELKLDVPLEMCLMPHPFFWLLPTAPDDPGYLHRGEQRSYSIFCSSSSIQACHPKTQLTRNWTRMLVAQMVRLLIKNLVERKANMFIVPMGIK